jgi:hypothetical protein
MLLAHLRGVQRHLPPRSSNSPQRPLHPPRPLYPLPVFLFPMLRMLREKDHRRFWSRLPGNPERQMSPGSP